MPTPQVHFARSPGPPFPAVNATLWHDDTEIPEPAQPAVQPDEWTEHDVVLLHWRLLQEIAALPDPEAPLESKLDTLHWVFTEREKDRQPFSFVNCLKVVGCSPLSPIPYCGLVDPDEIRDHIRNGMRRWLAATLARYPAWVREEVARNPEWVESQLVRNPQWINEQVRANARQGDLFA